MTGAGIQSFAKLRAQMCTAVCGNPRRLDRGLPRIENCTADCQRQKYQFESGLPQVWPDRMYSWQPEGGAWQSAFHLRTVCQGVISVVASHGFWLRSLANERILVSPILHRQFLCLLRHTFLTYDFLCVRQILGGLFRPKLYTNGLSWQAISWYYPFKHNGNL
jgi:hypothetical protein